MMPPPTPVMVPMRTAAIGGMPAVAAFVVAVAQKTPSPMASKSCTVRAILATRGWRK